MPTIEIRRHSFTKKGGARSRGSHLSHEGVVAARELGPTLGSFDRVFASTSPRTVETAIAMGQAVDDLLEMPSPVETGEVEFHEWRAWSNPFTTLRTLADESAAIGEYIDRQVERLLAAVGTVDAAGRVLVIGHGGWIESVVAGMLQPHLAAAAGGSFWHLDGIRLDVDENATASTATVHRYSRRQEAYGVSKRRHTHSKVRDGKRLVWYTENLWRLTAGLPVFTLPLESVQAWTGAPALDEDCWFGGRPATLRDVAEHTARIQATSLEHPIILNDDGTLMDGGHRLCKALLEGRDSIKAVRFPVMPPADEVHDLAE